MHISQNTNPIRFDYSHNLSGSQWTTPVLGVGPWLCPLPRPPPLPTVLLLTLQIQSMLDIFRYKHHFTCPKHRQVSLHCCWPVWEQKNQRSGLYSRWLMPRCCSLPWAPSAGQCCLARSRPWWGRSPRSPAASPGPRRWSCRPPTSGRSSHSGPGCSLPGLWQWGIPRWRCGQIEQQGEEQHSPLHHDGQCQRRLEPESPQSPRGLAYWEVGLKFAFM